MGTDHLALNYLSPHRAAFTAQSATPLELQPRLTKSLPQSSARTTRSTRARTLPWGHVLISSNGQGGTHGMFAIASGAGVGRTPPLTPPFRPQDVPYLRS